MNMRVGKRRITSNTGSCAVYLNIYKGQSLTPLAGVHLTPRQARKLARHLLKYADRIGTSA